MSLAYQTALVSGAGSGMGRAIAQSLAQLGLRVALLGRDRAKLDATADLLPPSSAIVIPCDVADRAASERAVKSAQEELGSIDVLVCNAGINIPNRALARLELEDWDRLIATNLTGAFHLVYFAIPHMREQKKGLVVQISSISGKRAHPLGGIAYCAAKFGQTGMALCLGREERLNGIRSTVIYPGEVDTPILANRPAKLPPERLAVILQPEDVAEAVEFLVKLPPRANVPELVMLPSVDEWA
jgi:NAD(P)-dependent dehydrogenase (short-subunit alcohol dehydrogenase family)